jgi:hypothetical protein
MLYWKSATPAVIIWPGRSQPVDVPCRWSRVVVPGVAHEGMRMAAFAAQHWFDTALT